VTQMGLEGAVDPLRMVCKLDRGRLESRSFLAPAMGEVETR
jgi:hypothetical protein